MTNKPGKTSKFKSTFAAFVIPFTLLTSFLLFHFILGNPINFSNGDPNEGHPLNMLGIVYKGGVIVPVLLSFFIMVFIFSIERLLTIQKAYGKNSLDHFLYVTKVFLSENKIHKAIEECHIQKGSVGNIVHSVLLRYNQLWTDKKLTKEQKLTSIQKEMEEAISLELPMLEKNLTIIATLASVATLIGLLGTVIGMIKAFAALATAGSPDATALANGISEALINTALGIASSAMAIIAYNYFTSKIDLLTYSVDEIGFSIIQNFTLKYDENTLIPIEETKEVEIV